MTITGYIQRRGQLAILYGFLTCKWISTLYGWVILFSTKLAKLSLWFTKRKNSCQEIKKRVLDTQFMCLTDILISYCWVLGMQIGVRIGPCFNIRHRSKQLIQRGELSHRGHRSFLWECADIYVQNVVCLGTSTGSPPFLNWCHFHSLWALLIFWTNAGFPLCHYVGTKLEIIWLKGRNSRFPVFVHCRCICTNN